MSDAPAPNKPLVSFSVGPLSVSLWENDVQGADRKFKSVTIRKMFTNRDGHPDARTVSINTAEVGCLAGLLQKMEEAVIQQQEATPL
jgi:anthranilate phosphoribosyltransferase